MEPVSALVISPDPASGAAEELAGALSAAGHGVVSASPDTAPGEAARHPGVDVVLVSSAVPRDEVVRLLDAVDPTGPPVPALVFADRGADRPADLEGHVAAGLDYLTPPYTPVLVDRRLSARLDGRRTVPAGVDAALLQVRHELQIGRDIQRGFLPVHLPCPDGWEITARFEPAHVVAGDFYDVFEIAGGRRIGFLIADVCDKGIGAALFMALIRSLLRHTAEASGSGGLGPGMADLVSSGMSDRGVAGVYRPLLSTVGAAPLLAAVSGTNAYMTRNHLEQGYFATLFFGVLDPVDGTVVYINGGHNPPVLLRDGDVRTVLEPTGPAVGMFPDSTFTLEMTRLDPGDLLFLYTDGVTEAKDEDGGFFSDERMRRTLCASDGTAAGAVALLGRSLTDFRGRADQFDDITMMALRRHPEDP